MLFSSIDTSTLLNNLLCLHVSILQQDPPDSYNCVVDRLVEVRFHVDESLRNSESGTNPTHLLFHLLLRNSVALLRLLQAPLDLVEDNEAFDSVLDGGVIRQLADGLQHAFFRHFHGTGKVGSVGCRGRPLCMTYGVVIRASQYALRTSADCPS